MQIIKIESKILAWNYYLQRSDAKDNGADV